MCVDDSYLQSKTNTCYSLWGTSKLKTYSVQERDEMSKAAYNNALETTHEIIADIETRVKTLELEEPQYKQH